MVVDVALYTLVHQPRRLKLPAQPIPRYASIEDITRCLFDERSNEYYFRQVAQASYYPGARVLLEMAREQGVHLALGLTLSFVSQAERWEPALLDLFRDLAAQESVELVGVDPYHSLHCLLDPPAFAEQMKWMAVEMERLFGKRPLVTDTTEMCQSASIYNALDAAGFRGALFDGDPRILEWRASTYLYRYDDEQPYPPELQPSSAIRSASAHGARVAAAQNQGDLPNKDGLFLLARHPQLSADVSLRFSNSTWSAYPLYADTYAHWIAQVAGDYVLLNWDFESMGERHSPSTGIFDFIRALPAALERQGVALRTPGQIIERYAGERAYHLPLPVYPPVWSELLGLENAAWAGALRDLFQLLREVYDLARLTEDPALFELALWLAQSDHFRLSQSTHHQFAANLAPQEWWRLGPEGIIREQRQLYLNVLRALEPYLPARLWRQSRRFFAPVEPETSAETAGNEQAPAVATAQRTPTLSANLLDVAEISGVKTARAQVTHDSEAQVEEAAAKNTGGQAAAEQPAKPEKAPRARAATRKPRATSRSQATAPEPGAAPATTDTANEEQSAEPRVATRNRATTRKPRAASPRARSATTPADETPPEPSA
jgi:alpha-amylase